MVGGGESNFIFFNSMLKRLSVQLQSGVFYRFSHVGVGYPADQIVPVSVCPCFSHIGGGHPTDQIVPISVCVLMFLTHGWWPPDQPTCSSQCFLCFSHIGGGHPTDQIVQFSHVSYHRLEPHREHPQKPQGSAESFINKTLHNATPRPPVDSSNFVAHGYGNCRSH